VTESARTLFFRGVFANAINPKVALFFLSFLPQFVVAQRGGANLQTALLGLAFTAQAAILFGLLGYFSGAVGAWLNRRPRAGMWMDRIAGAIFIGLGLRLIVAR
jgi:threonine/homoserine/homoserine lactone efflux protein